jgi:hypothetical protein
MARNQFITSNHIVTAKPETVAEALIDTFVNDAYQGLEVALRTTDRGELCIAFGPWECYELPARIAEVIEALSEYETHWFVWDAIKIVGEAVFRNGWLCFDQTASELTIAPCEGYNHPPFTLDVAGHSVWYAVFQGQMSRAFRSENLALEWLNRCVVKGHYEG